MTASGDWRALEPDNLFLPDETAYGGQAPNLDSCVHPELAADGVTLAALKKIGIKPPSSESIFRLMAKKVLNDSEEPSETLLINFWVQARKVEFPKAEEIIREQDARRGICVRTRSGSWQPLHSVLLPGKIVPDDGSRDNDVIVDTDFHEPDSQLLGELGVTDVPRNIDDLSMEPWFSNFLYNSRDDFLQQEDLPRSPQRHLLNFASTFGIGPLEVFKILSDEGKSRYTDSLLALDATYEHWEMQHDTQGIYPKLLCESPAIQLSRKHGRIQTPDGVAPFVDALGLQPKNTAALHVLLAHPKADKIKEAFNLAAPTPEFIGEEEPIPLTDVWPGLERYLPVHRRACKLIRCERIFVGGYGSECVFHAPDIYIARVGDDDVSHELRLVSEALELGLTERDLVEIQKYETRQEIEEHRALVRRCSTDAERLLAAVGEQNLRLELPNSLLAILESDNGTLTGLQIAEAAIATYHTDALREYKWALSNLDPPQNWAGSARAVAFVHSLGFSEEWAGERNKRRDPYLEVEGPYSLPELHDYQVKHSREGAIHDP